MGEWSKIARRIRVPLGFVLVVFYFWLARPTWRSLLLGFIGIVPGLLIRGLASGHVRKNEVLASSGPYAYTRNPLYLGSLLMGMGFAVAARSWWIGAAMVVMFFAIYIPVIRDEEEFLRQRFPEFEEYARRVPRIVPRMVPRMVPRITAVAGNESERFSWGLYLTHREWKATAGAAAVVAGLVVKTMLFKS